MQVPVRQYCGTLVPGTLGQGNSGLHGSPPHVWPEPVLAALDELLLLLEPPSGVHSGGSSVLPRQYSQVSQGLKHPVCCVHGLQMVGSVACSVSHGIVMPLPSTPEEPRRI